MLSKAEGRWAVEVETGKSEVVTNVRNGLLAAFGKVVVVPTDKRARERLERELLGKGGAAHDAAR